MRPVVTTNTLRFIAIWLLLLRLTWTDLRKADLHSSAGIYYFGHPSSISIRIGWSGSVMGVVQWGVSFQLGEHSSIVFESHHSYVPESYRQRIVGDQL